MSSNVQNVSEAFSRQSNVFDQLNTENELSGYLRNQFREEVLSHLKPGSSILELNCGTGLDAVFFAKRGHFILANDNSPGMLSKLEQKIEEDALQKQVQTLQCSFHEISKIKDRTFDHIISNFGGLNCTDDLDEVLQQFSPLLNSNGKVTLMIMPKVCPWELAMAIKGRFKVAFRRFKKKTPAHIEGVHFYCYYYNPSYVKKALMDDFETISLKGVCITVPPEFFQNFTKRFPRSFKVLSAIDRAICSFFPFTYCCDHFLITLQKRN